MLIRQWNVRSNCVRKGDGQSHDGWSVINEPFFSFVISLRRYGCVNLRSSVSFLYTSTLYNTDKYFNKLNIAQTCKSVIMIEKMIRLIIDNWYRSRKYDIVFPNRKRRAISWKLFYIFPTAGSIRLNDSEQRVIIIRGKSINSDALFSDCGI